MGKLNIFEISLNNPQGIYYGGQIIEGQLTVETNAEMKMRGIKLYLKGKAHVHWTERHRTGTGDNRRTETRHYTASEGYFDHCIVLFGKGPDQQGEDPVLAPGRYTYPFSYQLPASIPSSYESRYGNVRYSMRGVIDRPWRFDHTTKRVFTVIGLLDLNQEPLAPQSPQATNQKEYGCLCCLSGPLSAVLRLDKTGYVPGEAISISGEITNNTDREMSKSFCDLRMTVHYTGKCFLTTKTKSVTNKIGTVTHGAILPGDSDIWNGDKLIIPPLPPSGLRGCSIIDISYTVSLHVDPTGIGYDLVVPINIIIGTIPLQATICKYGPPPPPAIGFSDISPPPTVPSAPDMPPPTYEESVFGKVNTQEENDTEYTRGSREYAPVYTYYNWNQHNSIQPQEIE